MVELHNYFGPKARHRVLSYLLLSVFLLIGGRAAALENPGQALKSAEIKPALGTQIDLELELYDQDGNPRKIKDLVKSGRPLIVVPSYFGCPRLCGLVLGAVAQLVGDLDLDLGQHYSVATVSFDPRDTPRAAAEKRAHYAGVLAERKPGLTIAGWDFLTGSETQTAALMQQLGFGFFRDGEEFAHGAAIFIVTPGGQLAQYFANINFDSSDVRLALVQASEGHVGNALDQVMLFCFKFDSTKGRYTLAIERLLKVVGAITLLALGFLLAKLILKERRNRS